MQARLFFKFQRSAGTRIDGFEPQCIHFFPQPRHCFQAQQSLRFLYSFFSFLVNPAARVNNHPFPHTFVLWSVFSLSLEAISNDQRFLCRLVLQCVFCLGWRVFSDEFHPSHSPLWLTNVFCESTALWCFSLISPEVRQSKQFISHPVRILPSD